MTSDLSNLHIALPQAPKMAFAERIAERAVKRVVEKDPAHATLERSFKARPAGMISVDPCNTPKTKAPWRRIPCVNVEGQPCRRCPIGESFAQP
ncbi:MAG: hypothetical protein ABI205_05820 [Gemmatimonadaceae bacterium]